MLFKDKMAFKEVFMTYYVPLCNFANGYLKNDSKSEDVVQDVFFHLWKNNDQLIVEDSMKALLFKAVKNKALEQLRKDSSYSSVINTIPAKLQSEEFTQVVDEIMIKEKINNLLRHLPPKCKKVFALHRLNGLTYAEIARQEGIAEKTVENHMMKAIKILRSEYLKSRS